MTTTTAARTYYPELDGVRAIAAMMVIFFHMGQMGIPLRGPISFGQSGVDLFFVLSGFLITSILLKARPEDWGEVRKFYVRRSLRIFPLYYGYLIVATIFGAGVTGYYWVYLQNYRIAMGAPMGETGHFWSLAVEEQFYLVWPFVVLFLPRRHLVKALWLVLGGCILCRTVLVTTSHVDVFYLTLTRLDGLCGGALLAVYQYRGLLRRLRGRLILLGILSIVLVSWQGVLYHGEARPWVEITKYTFVSCLFTSGIGLLLVSPRTWATGWLAWTPMRFLGRISYGLYVFHPAVLRFSFSHLHGSPAVVRAGAALLLTLGMAVLSWYGYEKPFLRMKDRWAPEMEFPASAVAHTPG